jgi:hypothetical protein
MEGSHSKSRSGEAAIILPGVHRLLVRSVAKSLVGLRLTGAVSGSGDNAIPIASFGTNSMKWQNRPAADARAGSSAPTPPANAHSATFTPVWSKVGSSRCLAPSNSGQNVLTTTKAAASRLQVRVLRPALWIGGPVGWHSLRRKFVNDTKADSPIADLCYLGGWKSPLTVMTVPTGRSGNDEKCAFESFGLLLTPYSCRSL